MSIPKAFLSHSSKDKEFVRAVAQELGRQYCIYDEKVFKTGDEFKKSIENGLDSSSIFVLFASKHSLLSDWVNFEVEEAWYKKLERNLPKSLVYIISDSDIEEIPIWLRRAKVQRNHIPKAVAREIRTHLDQLVQERKNTFVGRHEDIQSLQEVLAPADSPPPHVFFVIGLPGIGRRSLIQKVVQNSLDLEPIKSPFRLGEGSSIQDICCDVANSTEPYSTDLRFKKIMEDIQALSKNEAVDRTVANLRKMTNNGELPIFLDEGGLFDSDGNISEPIQSIIQTLSSNDEAYIAIVSSRRPFDNNQSIAKIRLNPLKTDDRNLLIRILDQKYLRPGRTRKKPLTPNEISELAAYTAGYPPSAYAAMELVEEYGIDAVLADKLKLVELRIDHFLKHFSTTEKMTKNQQNILCLLASYSPLPLTVIASTFSKSMKDISSDVSRLINLSFVVVEDKLYRVSDPIEDAAIKAFGLPEAKSIKSLADSIVKLIDEPDFEESRLNLHRILYRASWYIRDESIKNRVIYLFNDLMKIIKTLYNNDRNYSKVIEATEVALIKANNKSDYEIIFSYRARSFINQEKWQEAEQEIKKMKEHAPLRNVYYLYGFLNRKQGKNQEAINAYLESQKCGRNDEALHRELGQCYFFIGDYEKANEYVQKVLQRQKHHKRVNFYALDLQVQIAIALGDKEVANQSIALLQDIDESAYYYRKSKFEFLFGDKHKAGKDAENARKFSKNNNPRFHTLAHLALCHITTGEIDKAQNVLNEIDQKFGAINLDIRKGLRAKLAIARNRYEDALSLSNELKDKSSKSYKSIRWFALHGYLDNCVMSDSERTKCEIELMKLKAESASIEEVELTPEIDSYFDLD